LVGRWLLDIVGQGKACKAILLKIPVDKGGFVARHPILQGMTSDIAAARFLVRAAVLGVFPRIA
jgi:hypothetical protein